VNSQGRGVVYQIPPLQLVATPIKISTKKEKLYMGTKLSKMKLARLESGFSQTEVADNIKSDKFMLSKFENGQCLPMPNMWEAIAEIYHKLPRDIIEGNTLCNLERILKKPRATQTEAKNYEYKHIGCFVRRDMSAILTKQTLKACGYKDLTNWIYACIKNLNAEYQKSVTKEKTYDK